MEIFLIVLVLLAVIGLSNIVNRFLPFVPVPVIQIGLGVIVAIVPSGIHLPLSPEVFFVLFIAPLLFNDGKNTPRDELWTLRAPILLLALGLVFITVLVAGYFIHWLIPSIPLPAAFALAAILSPTDAVAVSSLAGRVRLPKEIMRLLEGEALMNDASGLVAFKFAIAAAVTGYFSLAEASLSFIFIAVGGLVMGALLSFFIIGFRVFIRRLGMEDITMHMLIQILTPFVLYLAAEELGLSGILAVVAGGIVHAIERDRAEASTVKLQVVSGSTWSVILFLLNGLVFVILGLQLPAVGGVIWNDNAFVNGQVIGYILLIFVLLIFLRFTWVFLFWGKGKNTADFSDFNLRLRSSLLITFSGVRGAVTLAGAFSIPFVLQDGSPFPQRDLIIFVAAGVILISLVAASIFLPLLSRNPEHKNDTLDEDHLEREIRIKLMKAAMQAIRQQIDDTNEVAAREVINEYGREITRLEFEASSQRMEDIRCSEKQIRLISLEAERQEIKTMIKQKEIQAHIADPLLELIDQREYILTQKLKLKIIFEVIRLRRMFVKAFAKQNENADHVQYLTALRAAKQRTLEAAIAAIREHITDNNRTLSLSVISHHREMIASLHGDYQEVKAGEDFGKDKKALQLLAIQAERDEVQRLFEQGEVSRSLANKLRQFINYMETVSLEEEDAAH
ncbi:CPA1 family monovalent cation:H+ antiporter [Paenibacillus shirakamiensis]|uniref:CPA1 family monovalent cation:H+ antiporter n=1 Tax=Paenibacillus shirakamiensis TaxID=1265935 RepID=A0ABS4JII6_9BACL|nr:CPA1 family monovalent cation:H+ antiporter [Paenibacillus shirakamiensis]